MSEVEKFIQKGIGINDKWEFDNYYPTPKHLLETNIDWYFWRTVNWGTKWNPEDVRIESNEINFLTAWTPPLGLLLKISGDYPEMTFKLTYFEEEMGFAGLCEIQEGDYIFHEEGEVCYVDENGNVFSRDEREMDGDAYSIINPFEIE